MAIEAIESDDYKKQKKAYKILEEILELQYVMGSEEMLLKSLSKTNAPSQASRLKCLTSIIKNLPEKNEKYLFKIVPETVLCIKAANEKARSGEQFRLLF